MNEKRIQQLRDMTERGAIRKGHITEMLNWIEHLRVRISSLGDRSNNCVTGDLGGDVCEFCKCGKSDE